MSHRKKLANLIIWEMHRFSLQFPIAWENATKPIVWEEPRKLTLILYRSMGAFFPSDSHSMYGILHHMRNA